MKSIQIIGLILSLFFTVTSMADAPQWRSLTNTKDILTPKQRLKRSKQKAFRKKIMNMSYGDLEEEAQSNKKIAHALKKLNKKGIKNAAHYEQYKARRKGEVGRQMYPRSWKKAGNNRDDIYEKRVKGIQ